MNGKRALQQVLSRTFSKTVSYQCSHATTVRSLTRVKKCDKPALLQSHRPVVSPATCFSPFIIARYKSSAAEKTGGSFDSESIANSYLTSNVFDLLSLKDRVVVLTGAAKGIGLGLAFAVAEAGGKIAIVDAAPEPDVAYDRLKEICSDLRYYRSDVTKYEILQETFNGIVRDFGRIDGLVTAAGICPDQPFLERDPDSVRRCMEINNLGTYYSAQLAARQMVSQPRAAKSSGRGSIVMIASMAAHRASKDQFTSDYCMSKGGVLSLTKQLGVELAEKQIRVNCISPGYIATDLLLDLVKERPDLGETFRNEPPMGRIGDRTDLKAASVFLLSDASAYMTSGEMLITGGLHAGRV